MDSPSPSTPIAAIDPWAEPIAHDVLALHYAGLIADPETAHTLARAHAGLWCLSAKGDLAADAVDGVLRKLGKAGLGADCLNDGNARVARELLDVAVARMGRRKRANDPGLLATAALETRIAADFRAKSA